LDPPGLLGGESSFISRFIEPGCSKSGSAFSYVVSVRPKLKAQSALQFAQLDPTGFWAPHVGHRSRAPNGVSAWVRLRDAIFVTANVTAQAVATNTVSMIQMAVKASPDTSGIKNIVISQDVMGI